MFDCGDELVCFFHRSFQNDFDFRCFMEQFQLIHSKNQSNGHIANYPCCYSSFGQEE